MASDAVLLYGSVARLNPARVGDRRSIHAIDSVTELAAVWLLYGSYFGGVPPATSVQLMAALPTKTLAVPAGVHIQSVMSQRRVSGEP